MAMDETARRRLRELAAKRRKTNPKPADLTLDDWAVACDWVQEHPTLGETREGYFRYVPTEVVGLLAKYLPTKGCWVAAGPLPGGRLVTVFTRNFAAPLLQFLGLNANKYFRCLGE